MPKRLIPYTDSEPENVGTSPNSSGDDKAASSGWSDQSKARERDASGDTDSGEISHMSAELQDLIRRSNPNYKNSESSGEDCEEEEDEAVCDTKSKATGVASAMFDYGLDGDDDGGCWTSDMEKEFVAFKCNYYKTKMHFEHVSP